MSDNWPGPGWWKASDGKWYAPPAPPPPNPGSSPPKREAPRPKDRTDDGPGCAGAIGVIATIIVMIIFAPLIIFVLGWGFIIGAVISVASLVVLTIIWLVTGKDPRE